MSQDTGLIKRGLFLLTLMSGLVICLLVIMFQRTGSTVPPARDRPELRAIGLVRSDAAFPGAVAWLDIYQMGEAFPSAGGWEIRYNAARALAMRGSAQVPWDILLEMLDEDRQMHNFRVQLQNGKVVPNETEARLTMLNALRAVADWHKKQTQKPASITPELAKVYQAVDQLAASPIMEVKSQAENTRKVFFR